MAKLRIVVVGAGQVSRELAPAWQRTGHDILHVVSRTAESAKPLGELLGCSWSTNMSEAAGALRDAEVVVIAVTDGLISEISTAITNMISPSCLMVHVSGATPLDHLRAPCAVLWPIRSFNPKADKVPLANTPTVLEASEKKSMVLARLLASAWDADVSEVSGTQRAAAHMAAAVADNFANHMFAEAQNLLDQRGLPKTLLRNLVLGLTQGGLQGDSRERQTGPARRGDEATLARHRALLPEDVRELYDTVTAHIIHRHSS